MYHQVLHDTKKRGIEVGDVKLNLEQMMKAKDTSVESLTKGIEYLLKKNKVDYVKGTGSFVDQNTVKVDLLDGGEQVLKAKNIIVATGSESTPFPGLKIDEKRIITSTGALSLKEVPKKMVVIGGGIIGLEMVGHHMFQIILRCFWSNYLVGICLVATWCRSYRCRIPEPDRWSWYGH